MKIANPVSVDITIIGAGIIGTALAWKLSELDKNLKIVVLDKEVTFNKHQTGRNSGVIHSGVYYPKGSLKSQNCINGYQQLLSFLDEHSITYSITGKLIATANENDYPELERLFKNSESVGLSVNYVEEDEIKKIDPNLVSKRGFLADETGITDFKQVLIILSELSEQNGVTYLLSRSIKSIVIDKNHNNIISTQNETIHSNILINCAGLHCDRVFSLATGLKCPITIIPFKGEYFKVRPDLYQSDIPVYPVPNPDFPFLGVHLTRMINGSLKVGPNAVLSLDREGYDGFQINLRDAFQTVTNSTIYKIAARYKSTVLKELLKQGSITYFEKNVKKYWSAFNRSLITGYTCGIRAQATEKGEMVTDFRIEIHKKQVHVLNAPSPAATACLSIADTIISQLNPLLEDEN